MRNRNLVISKNIFQCSMRCFLLLFFLPIFLLTVTNRRAVVSARAIRVDETKSTLNSDPGNVHAIIVSSSRYWFNYRHAINALGMYEIYRQNGIPDENIILSTFFGCIQHVDQDRSYA
jgi:glycosylphosphatidylinositol transamidase (GPIT) subunit GPI8